MPTQVGVPPIRRELRENARVTHSRLVAYGLVVLLAAVVYLHDLASPHIPKNGDEYPYTHITRLTAASGTLLPLCSDLPEMRNT
jgi:hypothetical protein